MFGTAAVLVYLLAMGIPIYLLYRFHTQFWYWHVLSIGVATGLGFIPTPYELKTPEVDLCFGFVFIATMVWGAGGLILYRPHSRHHEKHA